MKFTLIKDIKKDAIMKPVLNSLLFFIILYLSADFFVKHSTLGLFPHAVNISLFGDEEQFIDPISTSSFLEAWHVEIFLTMMLLFTLSTVYIKTAEASKQAVLIVNAMFLSAITSLISLALCHFLGSLFVNIYVVSFFVWHILALFSSLYSLKRLNFA